MKRTVSAREFDALTMADCLMLLSRGRELESMMSMVAAASAASDDSSPSRVFECKTCNRQFPSFQALGGHRASHKKPRLAEGETGTGLDGGAQSQNSPAKPKTHECSICGLEFAIGQALGGHMRRHRAAANDKTGQAAYRQPPIGMAAGQIPVVMKKSSSRRVLCLDLNLTPMENDLEFRLGRKAPPPPMVDCFF